MAMKELTCDMCGKKIFRYPSQVKERNFCSRECLGRYSSKTFNPDGYRYKNYENASKHMSNLNRELNPHRMTEEIREKLSAAKFGTGEKTAYLKKHGRHIHRTVAEELLGRPLRPGEVVHHIDGNKHNNAPENLMIFPSQAEHVAYHNRKEAKPDEVHTA